MTIRGLLLGTATAIAAASSAFAADAIVIAEPEPLEYVRICDVYGAGFFYIPGTQNCLQIGGYVRYRMDYGQASGGVPHTFTKTARFAPTFDVRSETEWGTLRGYAHVFFDWSPFGTGTELDQGFIELQTASGSLLIGKTDSPYARFFDYGADGDLDGDYGGQIYNTGEVSYTFNAGNGFSAVIAVVEPGTGLFEPNIEGGVKFEQDWGSVGAIVGYDNPNNAWGAKGVARVSFDPFSLGVHVLYSSSDAGVYGAVNPGSPGLLTSEWSVLGHAGVQFNEKISVNGYFQWFDATADAGEAWSLKGGLGITPVANLEILPEIRYTKFTGGHNWEGVLRITRDF